MMMEFQGLESKNQIKATKNETFSNFDKRKTHPKCKLSCFDRGTSKPDKDRKLIE